jgi:transposase
VVFQEIDNRLWEKILPYLPAQKPGTGRPRSDLRKTFNGILYVNKTGISWLDVPRMYGTKSTVHRLHLELCKSGAYDKINQILVSECYIHGKIDLSCCNIDTKSVKAKKGEISAMTAIKRLRE